jgi:hypothetical protein
MGRSKGTFKPVNSGFEGAFLIGGGEFAASLSLRFCLQGATCKGTRRGRRGVAANEAGADRECARVGDGWAGRHRDADGQWACGSVSGGG